MLNQLFAQWKSIVKPLVVLGLVGTLVFGNVHGALAASGGRMGGGSFRAPSRAPSRSISPSRGGGMGMPGGYGGGIGFPFLMPLFWGGGFGGIFTILIVITIANFLVRSFQSAGSIDENGMAIESNYGTVTVAKVQVGLLANARYLQKDLNELALSLDTSTPEGRVDLLQESTLSLLRHPEYWVYGMVDEKQSSLNNAETTFNQWSLTERGKFTEETLTNYNNQRRQASTTPALPADGAELAEIETGEYILVTVLVGVIGKLQLPKINDSEELKLALQQIGSMGGDRLLAVEVLWTPQAEGDVLTTDDILAKYPDLKLV